VLEEDKDKDSNNVGIDPDKVDYWDSFNVISVRIFANSIRPTLICSFCSFLGSLTSGNYTLSISAHAILIFYNVYSSVLSLGCIHDLC
jgi:hypothetical protein